MDPASCRAGTGKVPPNLDSLPGSFSYRGMRILRMTPDAPGAPAAWADQLFITFGRRVPAPALAEHLQLDSPPIPSSREVPPALRQAHAAPLRSLLLLLH